VSLHAGQTGLLSTSSVRSSSELQSLESPGYFGTVQGIADLVRSALRARLVFIFADATVVGMPVISAGSPELDLVVRASYSRSLQFASDLARRAVAIGEVISVSIDPATHGLANLLPSGTLLAAPLRLSSSNGAILVYPREDGSYSSQEKSELSALTGIASIAMNAASRTSVVRSPVFQEEITDAHEWSEILDAIPDLVVAHDSHDKVVCVNRALAEFIGVEPKDMAGVGMPALFTMDNGVPQHVCPFCRGMLDEPNREQIVPVLDRSYLVFTSYVDTSDGQLHTLHVLRDISDRQEAESRYKQLFDNMQEGVFFATPDGRFVEVNNALVRMLGHNSRTDLLQANIRTQISISPERYDEFSRLLLEQGTVRDCEQTLRRADGTLLHAIINAFAVHDDHRGVVQFRGAIQDVSRLKSSQSELHRERDFSAKVLDNTQSLILVTDVTGRVSYANRRWYEMGYQQPELLGRPLQQLIAPARRPALLDAFASTLAGRHIDSLELQVLRSEGGVGHFAVNLSPVLEADGNVASVVVVMSDITDAATLQSKLMHAEKMAAVGQLVSGVAHEVNNPLTAILGFADLLMENPELPDSARKDLRVILQEAQRTKQIVQNLLSFARQVPPQRKTLQLNVILRRTVQLRAYDLHSRGVEVVEILDENLQSVNGDAQQLQQVFLNILNNAYDAVRDTGRAARIQIQTRNIDRLVEIAFRDNGQGIQFPERIFDPFFTTKAVGKGTGLGLSICYGIVREHGGEIACHNNSDGEGATFLVRLPAIAEPVSVGASAGGTQS
jgi:two-component system NtrC family sensor kinase